MTGRVGNPKHVALFKRRSKGILRALKSAIRQGKPCPSNADLASAAGMTIINNLRDVLRRMQSTGIISIQYFGPITSCKVNRSITICATGAQTLPTRDLAEARPSKPRKPQPMPRCPSGGATNRTMGGAADGDPPGKPATERSARPASGALMAEPQVAGGGRIAASRPVRASAQRRFYIGPIAPTPPTSRELRAEELRLMEEHIRTKGLLRLEGKLQTVWTNEEAVAALKRMGLTVRRGHLYSSVGGRKVLTNKLIDHANMMLQERQTVRVRQEPEGARA